MSLGHYVKHEGKDWHSDIEEIVAFVKWFLEGSSETWRCATDIFDSPWLYEEDYRGFKEDQEDQKAERNRLRR